MFQSCLQKRMEVLRVHYKPIHSVCQHRALNEKLNNTDIWMIGDGRYQSCTKDITVLLAVKWLHHVSQSLALFWNGVYAACVRNRLQRIDWWKAWDSVCKVSVWKVRCAKAYSPCEFALSTSPLFFSICIFHTLSLCALSFCSPISCLPLLHFSQKNLPACTFNLQSSSISVSPALKPCA